MFRRYGKSKGIDWMIPSGKIDALKWLHIPTIDKVTINSSNNLNRNFMFCDHKTRNPLNSQIASRIQQIQIYPNFTHIINTKALIYWFYRNITIHHKISNFCVLYLSLPFIIDGSNSASLFISRFFLQIFFQ